MLASAKGFDLWCAAALVGMQVREEAPDALSHCAKFLLRSTLYIICSIPHFFLPSFLPFSSHFCTRASIYHHRYHRVRPSALSVCLATSSSMEQRRPFLASPPIRNPHWLNAGEGGASLAAISGATQDMDFGPSEEEINDWLRALDEAHIPERRPFPARHMQERGGELG